MPSDAPPDANPVRPVLRVSEHDRVSRRAVSVAPRHLPQGSVLHHTGPDGALDVLHVLDRVAQYAAEPTGEDDDVHDARHAYRLLPESRVGAEPVLRSAKRGGDSTAMATG